MTKEKELMDAIYSSVGIIIMFAFPVSVGDVSFLFSRTSSRRAIAVDWHARAQKK
jgi:hypothetical protein